MSKPVQEQAVPSPPTSAPRPSAIQIDRVSKTYASKRGTETAALDDVSLAVAEGEFVTLLGPSGCGKSTLLKIIAGLTRKTSGQVSVHDEPIRGARSDIGMVFQSPTLLPWRSIVDNVVVPADVLRHPRRESIPRAMELLEIVGLTEFASHYPNELSGGMQQRVGIARALIHDPSVLLMDEPFGALDALTRDRMAFELLSVWSRFRKTVVFVTHSIQEAVLLGDRVVVMSARPGRIAEILPVEIPRPRDRATLATPEFIYLVNSARETLDRFSA